jgi:uracil-DNA glycosylase
MASAMSPHQSLPRSRVADSGRSSARALGRLGEIVADLAAARIGRTFNQYAEGPRSALLCERLVEYLATRADAPFLLVGEAAGYRGARISGIPFTSERHLTGCGPAEATATVVQRVLSELAIEPKVLLWNVVPTHPGTATSNRPPTRAEIDASTRYLLALAEGRQVLAVGRLAQHVLGAPYVRHPAHGGAKAFREALLHKWGTERPAVGLVMPTFGLTCRAAP